MRLPQYITNMILNSETVNDIFCGRACMNLAVTEAQVSFSSIVSVILSTGPAQIIISSFHFEADINLFDRMASILRSHIFKSTRMVVSRTE